MATIIIYNQQGEKKKELEVSNVIFDAPFKEDLIHQALVRQHANARPSAITWTKTKSEVRGGGRKPFPQKGTGQARQGSIRNPHFRGGGIAFGPKNNRNFTKNMPRKQRRLALFSALSYKHRQGKVIGLDQYEAPKINTKHFLQIIHKLPIQKDVLIVIPKKDPQIEKSSRNLPLVKTILINYLNIADLQKYDEVLFLEEALEKLPEIFMKGAKTAKE